MRQRIFALNQFFDDNYGDQRIVQERVLPKLFSGVGVAPVEDYPERLLQTLIETASNGRVSPTVVVLTPGGLDRALPRSIDECVTNSERAVHEITGVPNDYYPG